MTRSGAPPPRPPPRPLVELEGAGEAWPPRAVIHPDHRSPEFSLAPSPVVSRAPPGLKRLGWMQTFAGATVVLLAAGWKAHDIVADYPQKTEVASICAGQITPERETREMALSKVVVRLADLEDAGVRAQAVDALVLKRLEVLERRAGVRAVVQFSGP